ncbi:MAG: endospore germination permease [Bacillota bacterium]|nr:endospore germination permease [Bacillota bacterium]
MLREKVGIGPGLLFMVLYVSIFSYGVSQAPRVAALHMGNNGYWGFLLAFAISIPVILGISWLGRRFPGQSVIQYLPQIVGTILGKLLGFIFLMAIMVLMVWTSRAITEEVSLYFLSRTPIWATVALFLLVALYAAYQGIEGVARLAAFVFPVTFFFSFMAILFSFQNFELDKIRPLFLINGFTIPLGSVHMFYPFIVLLTVLVINPYLTEKQKSFKAMTGAAVLAFLLIFATIVSGIGNFGASGILRYSYPVLELTRKANLPFVLQTFGLFFGATWLSQVLVATGFFYFVLSEGAAQLFNVSNYKLFTLILFPVTYVLIMLPSGIIDLRAVFPALRFGGFALTLGFVLLLPLVATLRGRGDQDNAS